MSLTKSCIAPDRESQLADPREKKREQNRLAQRAYRERLKAKLEGLQDRVSTPDQHVDASPGALAVNSAFDSKTVSTTESEIATLSAHHDPTLGTVFDLESIDATDPSHGCDASHHLDFFSSSEFPTTISPDEPSFSWDMHNDSRESQDNCSTIAVSPWFGLSKPGPIEKARPHSVGHVNANGKAANIDCSSPVQDRIRHIVGQATKAGFATFDEAIEAYYTESFDETSQLDRDQRLSRNRRLPRLLGTLRDASKGWSHWERRGFQEQITQGAEDILVEELNLFKTQCPDLAFRRDIVNMELEMTEAGTNRIMSNSRKFQDHLPNLWALATTLVAKTNASKHDTNFDAVLSVIETLCLTRNIGSKE